MKENNNQSETDPDAKTKENCSIEFLAKIPLPNKDQVDILFTAFLLAFIVYIVKVTLGYDQQARFVPLIVSMSVLSLLVLLFVRQLIKRDKNKQLRNNDNPSNISVKTQQRDNSSLQSNDNQTGNRDRFSENTSLVKAVFWTFLLAGLVLVIGIFYGGFIFLVLFYRYQTELKWPYIVLYVGITMVSMWFIFIKMLQLPITNGLYI